MNNFTFSTPRICDCGGDLSKQWYIYFRAKDESTGDTKQFRYKLGINRFKKKRERQEAAKAALATVISMLEDEVGTLLSRNARPSEGIYWSPWRIC